MIKKFSILSTLLFALSFMSFPVSSAYAFSDLLIDSLTSQLGVTEDQAIGGSGSILDYAQNELTSSDYSTVSSSLSGMDGLISKAPDSGSSSSSLLGQATSLGISSLGGAEGIATLANDFTGLGMSPEMIQQFVPIILDLAESEGGQQVYKLLETAILGD